MGWEEGVGDQRIPTPSTHLPRPVRLGVSSHKYHNLYFVPVSAVLMSVTLWSRGVWGRVSQGVWGEGKGGRGSPRVGWSVGVCVPL